MPKRNFSTIDEFRANLHKEGATLLDFEGKKVPCILLDSKSYDEILKGIGSTAMGVDTVLDIFHNGKDVFVDVQLNYRRNNEQGFSFEKNYLFYANNMMEFFESLSESGLLAITPSLTDYSSSKVFMIQLPKREAIENALRIIKTNARTGHLSQ